MVHAMEECQHTVVHAAPTHHTKVVESKGLRARLSCKQDVSVLFIVGDRTRKNEEGESVSKGVSLRS